MPELAVISDIHGNSIALKAVLADLKSRGGAEQLLVLGDLVAFGPDPAGVLGLLRDHASAIYILGDTDRYLVERQYPTRSGYQRWQAEILASFFWTAYQLSAVDLRFLGSLSRSKLIRFDDEHVILAVHGSPRSDEESIFPQTPDIELERMLADNLFYNLLLCGHTHIPFDRVVDGRRVVNSGSVGLPFNGDPRASYVLIDLKPRGGYEIEFRQVAYDIEAVVAQLNTVRHPAAVVQSYNLRTARPLAHKVVYTDVMRQAIKVS
jgi:putative phosphoesterase